ncbi:MAG TPA: PAS domain S-box protein, partial [Blastocatellia bacterium]|nr:PAS domain S-box protein [Blastocatellia bacterium]
RTLEDKIEGVVISFIDITAREAAENRLKEERAYAEAIVNTVREPLIILDKDLRVVSASRSFYEAFQVAPEETEGNYIYALGNHQWDIPHLRELLENILPQHSQFQNFEVEHEFAFVGRRTMLLNAREIRRDGEGRRLILLAIADITKQKEAAIVVRESETRQTYLLELSDAIRTLRDAVNIVEAAAQTAMNYFQADRCYYCEIEGDVVTIRRDAHRADLPSVANTYSLSEMPLFKSVLQSNQPIVVPEVNTSDVMDDSLKQLCLAVNITAYINVPVLKDNRLVGAFCLTQSEPRIWTNTEIDLARETAERTWAAIERAHAEEALRESEEKYRTLFNSIDEGVTRIEMIFDENDKAVDFRYLETNPVITKMAGLPLEIIGKKVSEVIPNLEPFWLETYGRVVKTGEPVRFEYHVEGLNNRWFDVYAARVGGEGSREVVVVYNNITERKRTEAKLAFLAEISQDLVRLTNIDDTMNVLGAKIGAYFNLSACAFADIDEATDTGVIKYGWHRDDAPSLVGSYRISAIANEDFFKEIRAGKAVVVRDAATDPRSNPETLAALGIGSYIDIPLFRDGVWRFQLAIYDSTARDWRDDEITLVRELATRIWTWFERARAEAALRKSEEHLRLATQAAAMYAWEYDVTNKTYTFSENAPRVLGIALENLPRTVEDTPRFINPEDRALITTTLEQAIKTGEGFALDFRSVKETGEIIWLDVQAMVIKDANGKSQRVIGIAQDITERKQTEEELRQIREQLEAKVEERTSELRQMNAELQTEIARRQEMETERQRLLQRIVRTQEEERHRISREIHDSLGQQLTVLRLGLENLQLLSEKDASARLTELQEMLRRLDEEIDFLAWELRPASLDELGLIPALARYIEEWGKQFNLAVDFHTGETNHSLRFLYEIESNLYRIAQEALNNVAKHAQARHVSVLLEGRNGHIFLIVEDDGVGFDPKQHLTPGTTEQGLGIVGMRERASLIGGVVEVESSPGNGTTIFVRVPIKPEVSEV